MRGVTGYSNKKSFLGTNDYLELPVISEKTKRVSLSLINSNSADVYV